MHLEYSLIVKGLQREIPKKLYLCPHSWMIPPMSHFSTGGKVKLTSPITIIRARANINRSSYLYKLVLLVTDSDLPLSCSVSKVRSMNTQAFFSS